MSMFFSAGILSLDSLIVSVALSPLVPAPGKRWLLAGLFGLWDALAVPAGFACRGSVAWADQAIPFFLIGCGLYALVAAVWRRFTAHPGFVYFLPAILSLDNFAYGAVAGPLAGSWAVRAATLGLASFALAALGLFGAGWVRFANVRVAEASAGGALIAAGLLLFSL